MLFITIHGKHVDITITQIPDENKEKTIYFVISKKQFSAWDFYTSQCYMYANVKTKLRFFNFTLQKI